MKTSMISSDAVVCWIVVTVLFGACTGSAQIGQYPYSGSETNITLSPGTYDITAYGAQGGYSTNYGGHVGGLGAEMAARFSFTTAVDLTILVSGVGASGSSSGGGGGGTFVVNGTAPLVVAGGGGGAAYDSTGGTGSTSTNGEGGGGGDAGGGGSAGNGGGWGGTVLDPSGGAGGGGYYTGAGSSGYGGGGGSSFLDGGGGGSGAVDNNGNPFGGAGGFGCGGGGGFGGGGGGGYSGGGGALSGGGGGGGSIIDSSAITNLAEISGVASPDGSPNGEVIIVVPQPPSFVEQPSLTAVFTSNVTFQASAQGPGILGFQWYFNGTPLSDDGHYVGSMVTNLTIMDFQTGDIGDYTLVATNYVGSTTSAVATINILNPIITSQPITQVVIGGNAGTFRVSSTGQQPLTYQWQFNGTNLTDGAQLSGSTNSVLTISNAQNANAGPYQVIVSNNYSAVTSSVALLYIYAPVQITGQSTNVAVLSGSNVSFTVTATGVPISYQWYFNGSPLTDGANISGSTNPTLNITDAQIGNTGIYTVQVTNVFSTAASSNASLTVYNPVQITAQPVTYAVPPGKTATFMVGATGTALGYQWYFNGTPLTDGGQIAGSASSALLISDVQNTNYGSYAVSVTNILSAAISQVALLAEPSNHYVNFANSAPASPYLTWSTAATNIQAAIDASISGDTVIVTDGVYAVGGEIAAGYSCSNRVVISKPLTVESVNGPANTIIEGNRYPVETLEFDDAGSFFSSTTSPDGPAAVRCVCITTNAALLGFTLADGATLYDSFNASDNEGAGVWCAVTNGIIISNCVITANGAYSEGGGAFQGTLFNCTLLGNSATTGGGAANATIFGSLLISNTANAIQNSSYEGYGGGAFDCAILSSAIADNYAYQYGGGVYGGTLVNCTVTENSALNYGGGTAYCSATNSIIYYNSIFSNQTSATNYANGTQYYCCTTPKPPPYPPGNITNEPVLADLSNISINSPCRGAGEPVAAGAADIDGNPWNNPPSIGCSEIPSAGDYGNLSIAISTSFTNWAPSYSLNLQASISGPVYNTVWNFGDGTIVSNSPYISHTWASSGNYPVTLTAYNDSYPTGITATLMINIAVPTTYYVNWASQNPVPPYSYWSTAASNIQDAVRVATPGSTVLVTNPTFYVTGVEGHYTTNTTAVYQANGTNGPDHNFYRAVITNAITLESVNGPATTWIAGNNGGCVYMTNNAVLNGFTLTNAPNNVVGLYASYTNTTATNCVITHCHAGGAYFGTLYNCILIGNSGGGSGMSTLYNCILSNNGSEYGGGALGGILNNCIIVSNTATYGGGAFGGTIPSGGGIYPLLMNNCFISNNFAQYGAGVSGYAGPTPVSPFTNCIISNCLITANSGGTSTSYGGGAMDAQLNNCIISSNKSVYGGGVSGGLANNCSLIGNTATAGGGGADPDYNNLNNPALTVLSNCTFIGNHAGYGGGAGFCTLNQCTLFQNTATMAGGGALVCIVNESQVLTNEAYYGGGASGGTLTNCLLAGNAANYGGGADGGYENNYNPKNTILNNCTLTANVATNAGGGAIECSLNNCSLIDNLSDFAGAGAAHAFLSDCIITNNSALAVDRDSRNPISGGGGVYACVATNCLLAQNFATTNGGGAFGSTLVNCTLSENTALFGGGSFNSTNDNCIVYYNNGGDYYPATAQYPLNYCRVSTPVTYGIRNITTAPLFVNLAGGDFHLQSSSPCINSGNNAYITSAIDLDGNPRIQGGIVDIGAYEYQTPTSVISYAYLQQYGLPTDGSVDFKNLNGTAFNVYQDWVAGLNPTNSASVLAMLTPVTTNTATGVTVTWQSVSGIPYFLQRSTNLVSLAPFTMIQNNIIGQTNTTSYTDTSATNKVPYFYRVGVVAP